MAKKKQPAKRRIGRPRKEVKEHTPLRSFRISDDDYAVLQQAADAAGKSLSGWMREKLLAAARRQLKTSG